MPLSCDRVPQARASGKRVLFSILSLLGCSEPEPQWLLRFSDPDQKAQSVFIRVEIRAGGCQAGPVLFRGELGVDAPPRLEPAVYGFAATAIDSNCVQLAAGCTELTLPTTETIRTELTSAAPVAACPTGTCNGGRCDPRAVTLLATGRAHSCALDFGQRLYCWGRNEDGQVGDGDPRRDRDRVSPVQIAQEVDAVELALGGITVNWRSHSCMLLRAGTIQCWGHNLIGQLGDGTRVSRVRPTPVRDLARIADVAAGGRHTCAIDDEAAVYCWGHNDYGQLGTGRADDGVIVPAPVGQTGAIEIAAGLEHTCVRDDFGRVRCWGRNHWGQLGDGTRVDRYEPVIVELSPELSSLRSIAAGEAHSCAVTGDGQVWCWGRNDRGQIGLPPDPTAPILSPARVDVAGPAIEVGCGTATSCARLQNGGVQCWGRNLEGQLGSGQEGLAQSAEPRYVLEPGGTRPVADAVGFDFGSDHGCLRRNDGRLLCWGRNQYGRLGDGTMTDRFVPVAVLGPGITAD